MENNIQNPSENQFYDPDKLAGSPQAIRKNSGWKLMVLGGIICLIVGLGIAIGAYYSKSKKPLFSSLIGNEEDISSGKKSNQGSGQADGCSSEYDNLLARYRLNENFCSQGVIRSSDFKEEEIKKPKTNIVLIFDSSGSMAAKIEGRSKIDIAKNATNKFVENIKSSGANLSVLLYGHKGSNSVRDKAVSCAGIDEVYWLDAVKPEIVREKFNNAKPTGWTPIAKSLEMAKDMLVKKTARDDRNIILLVSDGEETCNGNPVEMTKTIKSAGWNIKVNVIGFDVGGATEDQLRKIAEAGDEKYSSVKNEKDFEAIFQEQQNMLNKMDYVVKGGIEKLYDVSGSVLKHNQCQTMLDLEEAGFMLEIEKAVSEPCRSFVENKYFERYDGYEAKLRDIFEKERKSF